MAFYPFCPSSSQFLQRFLVILGPSEAHFLWHFILFCSSFSQFFLLRVCNGFWLFLDHLSLSLFYSRFLIIYINQNCNFLFACDDTVFSYQVNTLFWWSLLVTNYSLPGIQFTTEYYHSHCTGISGYVMVKHIMDYEFQAFSLGHLRPRSILRPSEGSLRHLLVSYTHHTIFQAIFLQRFATGFGSIFATAIICFLAIFLQRFATVFGYIWLYPLFFYPFFSA